MPYKRYKPDPSPDALHAAQLAQHLASANQNAALLSASLARIAGKARVPARSASACGPGG